MRPAPLRDLRIAVRAGLAAVLPLLLSACLPPCDYGQGDSVPVTMQGSSPLVPVEVSGRRVPFVLDTGASHTVFLATGAAALGLQVDRLRSSQGRGVAGETRERNALIARLRVGQHELRNLTVPVVAHTTPGAQAPAGLLGADFLRIAEVEIDLPARRVTLHDRRRCRLAAMPWQGAYDTIPISLTASGLVVLPAEVNGRPVRALFDTGAGVTVLRRGLAPAIGVPEEAVARLPAAPVSGIGTAVREGRLLRGATLRLGGETVRDAAVSLLDLPADMPFDLILGEDYIGARRFWLSYAEGILYVQRP